MKKIFLLILFVLCSVSGFAQDATITKVDEFIRAEMQKQKIPGVSLAVIKDGQIVYAKGYGFASVEHQVQVKPDGIFADIQLMERTERDERRIYRYRVNYRNFQDNFLMVTIGLTKDDKIAGVQLRPE